MHIQEAISSLLSSELKGILTEKYFNEIVIELDKFNSESIVTQNKAFYIKLNCQNFERQSSEFNYKIDINNTGLKKIFKMSAQNQRYKTTAILIIGILLGYYIKDDKNDIMFTTLSFDDKREILNNDRLIQRIENLKNIIFKFENGKSEIYENKHIYLEIGNEDNSIVSIEIDNEKVIIIYGKENKFVLNIEGEKTYNKYLEYILSLSLFNVHLVSKGRNFSKYILVEEAKKYWYSLRRFEDLLKNKQVKWDAFYTVLSSDEIKKRISSLNFLIKAQQHYPLYFCYRNNYLKYIEILKTIDEKEIIDQVEIDNKKELLYKLKKHKLEIKEALDNIFELIMDNISEKLIGDFSEKIRYLDEIFGVELSSELNLCINDSDIHKIRPFNITFIENGEEQKIRIMDTDTLQGVFTKLKKLQGDYYSANNIYHENRDKLRHFIIDYNETSIVIVNVEKEITIFENKMNRYKEYQHLKQTIEPYLAELEKVDEHKRQIIESNIRNAHTKDINKMESQLAQYLDLEGQEVFNRDKLSILINNIRDAYELFGKEVSDMSKGNVEMSTSRSNKQNDFLDKLIKLFEADIIDRCKFYFKATSKGVTAYKVKQYDFWERIFYSEDNDLLDLQNGLSGGTDSAMTVCSLATSTNGSKFGNILLVDEWGDVSDSFHEKVADKLVEFESFAFALFVDVDDKYDVIKMM